jgi:hypothetical protein
MKVSGRWTAGRFDLNRHVSSRWRLAVVMAPTRKRGASRAIRVPEYDPSNLTLVRRTMGWLVW